jgi:hypothetical protein
VLLVVTAWLVLGAAVFVALRRLTRAPVVPDASARSIDAARGRRSTPTFARADTGARLRAGGAGAGAVAGLLLGVLVGGASLSSILVYVVTGILVGVLVGESADGGPVPARRGAVVRRRRLSDYVGWPLLVVPVVGLIADLAIVGVGFRPHPTGAGSATCDGITWTTHLRWPGRPMLSAAFFAAILLAALVACVIHQVVRRRQTIDDLGQASEDDAMRRMTARQAILLAFAGQLLVLAGVAWSIGGGYVTPCQNRAALSAGSVSVAAFLGAIASLFAAGSGRVPSERGVHR